MDRYEYCKIFVHGADLERTTGLLASLFGTEVEDDSLTVDGIVVDVLENPDGDPDEADFVRWPVLVEVEPLDAAPAATVGLVSRLLVGFHDAGRLAVAACDYEDELPWSGGIELFRRWEAVLDRGAAEDGSGRQDGP
ncbi:hypothetical protein ACFC60_19800 [Kitasatospora purpeofusca]|uniref:hypothetical protein n=1 Tax=Kitasatospora purpeofusca TaxID=67352 RepID=UPI0035DAE29B